jgi:hypothetical protein
MLAKEQGNPKRKWYESRESDHVLRQKMHGIAWRRRCLNRSLSLHFCAILQDPVDKRLLLLGWLLRVLLLAGTF